MDVATWNVLHDGRLIAVKGSVPGDLTLTIEIEYLRGQLPSLSPNLTLVLLACERFEYLPYETTPQNELSDITALSIELLYAELVNDSISIEYADGSYGGKLLVKYENAVFKSAEGKSLTQGEVEAASERYWLLWEQKANQT